MIFVVMLLVSSENITVVIVFMLSFLSSLLENPRISSLLETDVFSNIIFNWWQLYLTHDRVLWTHCTLKWYFQTQMCLGKVYT